MSTLLHLYSHNPFLYPEHTLIVKKIIFEGRKASLTHISVTWFDKNCLASDSTSFSAVRFGQLANEIRKIDQYIIAH